MDQATLSGLIKSFGAADTPENTNRIREFYASDPKAAENRLYGSRMASDESGGSRDMILNSMLDKALGLSANNVPPSIEATTVPQMDTVKNATLPTKRSATAARPTDWTNVSENQNLGPVPARNASPGESAAAPSGGSSWDWLLPLLIGGVATGAAFRSPPVNGEKSQKASPRAIDNEGKLIEGANPSQKRIGYTPKIEGANNPTYESGAPVIEKGAPQAAAAQAQSPQDIARMQAEIDAENASNRAMEQQMLEQAKSKKSTSDLAKAARRATGRK